MFKVFQWTHLYGAPYVIEVGGVPTYLCDTAEALRTKLDELRSKDD